MNGNWDHKLLLIVSCNVRFCHVTNDTYITLGCLFFVYCSASKPIAVDRLVTRERRWGGKWHCIEFRWG